ncbi:DUF732 domain-containing protein [Mycobacterium sp. pR1184]|uniref:DUF732 domain-containing protein n=1 Tax=Mycobacterium sp. pR1184 TaxID=3238981 RepID=UPI00351BD4D4
MATAVSPSTSRWIAKTMLLCGGQRIIGILLAVGTFNTAAIGVATSASADSADFIQILGANGEDVSTQEIRYRSIDLGEAICDLLDANQDPNATVDYLVKLGHSNRNANMWMAAAVMALCPRLNYLTHYPPNR